MSSVEELKKQKELKRKEMFELDDQIEQLELKKYERFVGKYLKTAATSAFKVESISHTDDYRVYFDGPSVSGGIGLGGRLDIDLDDRNSLDLELIDNDEHIPYEISQEKFIKFMSECISYSSDELLKALK